MFLRIPHVVLLIALVSSSTIPPAFCGEAAPCSQAVAKFAFIGLEARAPTSWTIVPPQTGKRLIQFEIPAGDQEQVAEVVVFYFGSGEGGTPEANIERWRGQFITTKEHPVAAAVDRFQSNGMAITTAELSGTYARGIGVGPVGTPRPDQILLAAIVESPRGNLIVQLHGPAATVKPERDNFLTFLKSIRGKTS